MPSQGRSHPAPGRTSGRERANNKKGGNIMMDQQPKKWRQASLIVFVTAVVLIIPNLSRLVG